MGGKQKAAKEKPLEKMTATDLREMATGIDGVVGAHGMNKTELIAAIREAKGIEAPTPRKGGGDVRDIKKKIKALKIERQKALESEDERMAAIYRKRIIRLKKKSRRAS